MTRITVTLAGETIYDAFLDYDEECTRHAVIIESRETEILTNEYVDIDIHGEVSDAPYSKEFSIFHNGDTHFEDKIVLDKPMEINIGGSKMKSYDFNDVYVFGELAE